MANEDITSGTKKSDLSIKYDSKGNIIDFGGWESEEAKLRHNITWTPEQILQWLEEANCFNKKIREQRDVLRGSHQGSK
ncbi:MAG: hypothetical protein D8M57_04830 [Candidatus Scalindua sp. AMX11]|nr:MAG: hypothetical protein DWQ00_03765 [Candidatus Scalindua sp.]NOG84562.1 hypothetical protein [Planctomycetota bacterium]RZV92337.1 MAG: hypothetical protein EX341_04625 [Candidatus Scalindua sp. SCAELEC01]TDE66139.1 MAG: hypothetical protein D8M57_04830 [Candidatus Scalindua sp. AMX11]GJQ59112.1 MAG: hypothetical protein SCALA701_19130 [Candidatus Scalindua sp.]